MGNAAGQKIGGIFRKVPSPLTWGWRCWSRRSTTNNKPPGNGWLVL